LRFNVAATASLWASGDGALLLMLRFNMWRRRDCVSDLLGKHLQRMPACLLTTSCSKCFAGGLIAVKTAGHLRKDFATRLILFLSQFLDAAAYSMNRMQDFDVAE
jgi:hypothetical protein